LLRTELACQRLKRQPPLRFEFELELLEEFELEFDEEFELELLEEFELELLARKIHGGLADVAQAVEMT